MTALTDHGFGFGREDVCGMALAAARAVIEGGVSYVTTLSAVN